MWYDPLLESQSMPEGATHRFFIKPGTGILNGKQAVADDSANG